MELRVVQKSRWAGDLFIVPVLAAKTPEPGKPGKEIGDAVLVGKDGRRSLLISLGLEDKLKAESFRKVGGAAARWLSKNQVSAAGVDVGEFSSYGIDNSLQAFSEGLLLGSFRFVRHKSENADSSDTRVEFLVEDTTSEVEDRLHRVETAARAVNLAREWAHEPPNVINPITLAERASELANRIGLGCRIYDEKQLEEMGAEAILAVGKGSRTPSRLIVLEYPGKGEEPGSPVLLVGKAITFDTGGYTIKDKAGMTGMKYDKCGGVTVVGILQAAAELGLRTPVVGIIGAAENMISAESYRPDDIIKTLSGKTIEIVSADAEGRVVLCDALTYAQQHYQPRAIIDLATLTGGVVVALGKIRAGIMSNNQELVTQLVESGERVHERIWQLPLDEEYFDLIKGDDSDFKNSGARDAHAIIGGIFLKQFISEQVPWAHIDIAGVATTEKDQPYNPKGATGFGVRLILDYLESLER
ncbi:MAG: leucyl aminopeptidase [Chloroflexi bacterium]|nr:MAG: leucyl aminopeptidase [Chloroflexota bacterium]